MTTPPDFGGLSFEHEIQENLGAPPEPHRTRADDEAPARSFDDNEAHAEGSPCERCGAEIAPGEDARRRLDGQWVHEECPVPERHRPEPGGSGPAEPA